MSIASHHLEIFNGWLRFQMIPNSSSTNKIGHDLIFPKFLWKSFYLHISCQNTCFFSSIGNDTFYVTFYVKSDLFNVFHKVSISFLRFSFIWSTSEYCGIFINTKCPGVIIKYYLLLSLLLDLPFWYLIWSIFLNDDHHQRFKDSTVRQLLKKWFW